MKKKVLDKNYAEFEKYQQDWNRFARDMLRCKLDKDQRAILDSVQMNRRTIVRSGHARGKDFLTATAALCSLYLEIPSKSILTAPSGRQAISIMMSEIGKIWMPADQRLKNAGYAGLGGELLTASIKFEKDKDWYLLAFKASDDDTEVWTGFHSPNVFVGMTEGSGIADSVFEAVEGLLTGNSRQLIVGNPNRRTGTYSQSFRDPAYKVFVLDCMNAPNVVNKKIVYPGQVDWTWVNDHVVKPGWTTEISKEEMMPELFDFEWECADGKVRYYRPSDLFLVKVKGQFPRESEDCLYPDEWIELAIERWKNCKGKGPIGETPLWVLDVAGMGTDTTVKGRKVGPVIECLEQRAKMDLMHQVGWVKQDLDSDKRASCIIDSIGEGAGVYSRLIEQDCNVISAKTSESVRNGDGTELTDLTGERKFVCVRDYCCWALRDALDPRLQKLGGGNIALPPDPDLLEDLQHFSYDLRSDGRIKVVEKKQIRKTLKRSPDKADIVILSFYPFTRNEEVVMTGYDCFPSRG